jgi:hypothetical protein
MELVPEMGVEPPTTGSSEEVPAGATEAPVGALEVPPALKEEEAGILQFEVTSVSPHAPSISRGSFSPLPFFCCQGDANCPHPRACQGAQIEDFRDDRAAFREGAAGGGGGAVARYYCGRMAAAGRGGSGGLAYAGPPQPSPRAWVGSFGEPVCRGSRGDGGPC